MPHPTWRLSAAAAVFFTLAGCWGGPPPEAPVSLEEMRSIPVPEEHRNGENLFEAHCVACHGEKALGTEVGPPLIHPTYRTAHHSDYAFQIAIQRGVRAHHWRFGDMPPVVGLDDEEVARIIAYLRWLQRQAGID
jgi:mono/diheme cytochrome c family protein